MTTTELKGMAQQLYARVFGAGDLAAADEYLAPDCITHAGDASPTTGSDSIRQQALVLRTAIPDLVTTLEDQLADGDRVASRWTGSGTHSGPLVLPGGAIPPSGRPIRFGEIRIDRFADGRIVESWLIPDRFALWVQLGLIEWPPKPPAPLA